jgi:hypothetical protein
MIFITTNYYFDDEDNQDTKEAKETNMCFICFENELENKCPLTKLKDQKLFKKNCICDGWIHNECLTKWYNTKPLCPICRKFMVEIVYLPSCNKYLDHFLFFIEYYIINNHNSNNIFIITTKSSFLLLCTSSFIYSIYYYPIYYLLFFLLFFVFSVFYFILFVIITWSYRVTTLESNYYN